MLKVCICENCLKFERPRQKNIINRISCERNYQLQVESKIIHHPAYLTHLYNWSKKINLVQDQSDKPIFTTRWSRRFSLDGNQTIKSTNISLSHFPIWSSFLSIINTRVVNSFCSNKMCRNETFVQWKVLLDAQQRYKVFCTSSNFTWQLCLLVWNDSICITDMVQNVGVATWTNVRIYTFSVQPRWQWS